MVQVIDNFISKEEESHILSNLRKSRVTVGKGRNTVTRYGSDLPYKGKIVKQIPSHFLSICKKIEQLGHPLPDSVTVNEYHPTQSIDWHIDSPSSGPVIIVLSLQSDAVMNLRNPLTHENITINLPACSLLLLSEEHREIWEHSISPVLHHRFSIVFRRGTHVNV